MRTISETIHKNGFETSFGGFAGNRSRAVTASIQRLWTQTRNASKSHGHLLETGSRRAGFCGRYLERYTNRLLHQGERGKVSEMCRDLYGMMSGRCRRCVGKVSEVPFSRG